MGDDAVPILSEVPLAERVRELTVRSPALGRPATLQLILPRGWSADDTRTWPVLFLLHGADDGPGAWLRETDVLRRAAELDALVVAPEAGTVGFYSDWLAPDRSGTAPRWEAFHLDEVPRLLERRYRAGAVRVAAGVSMGGYGALAYAARRPGMFAAAASYSGLLHTTRRGMPAFVALMLLREREHRHALWGDPRRDPARWRAHDPWHLAEGLRGTALYLSSADGRRAPGDAAPRGSGLLESWVAPSTRSLAARLSALGIPATTSHGAGVHDWPTWRRELDRSWPFLAGALHPKRCATDA